MLRIAICDDEETARDALRIQLEKIMDEKSDEIIYEFSNGRTCANWIIHHPGEVDLLFLDVEMGQESGMDVAAKIRKSENSLLIVFVTGYSDYVFDGYRVGALDYLMKPVKADRLKEVLSRVKRELSKTTDAFVLKNTDGIYRLPYDSILYFFSDRRYINVVTAAKTYTFYGKLSEVEKQTKKYFVRIHQRYLVNAGKVTFIGNRFVTVSGLAFQDKLPVSRAYKESACEQLARTLLKDLSR